MSPETPSAPIAPRKSRTGVALGVAGVLSIALGVPCVTGPLALRLGAAGVLLGAVLIAAGAILALFGALLLLARRAGAPDAR